MTTYDFSTKIHQFNGNPIPEGTAATIFAQILGMDNKVIPARKAIIWGTALEKDGALEIDDADKKTLISFIETTELVSNLVKGQLLRILEDKPNVEVS